MNYNMLCLQCMNEKDDGVCKNCGFDDKHYISKPNTIPAPSVLKGRYLVGLPLGIGGFGITYIAYDMKVGGVCAIKEYMPDTVSYRNGNEQNVSVSESKLEGYRYGLNRFLEEAQMLLDFSKSKNIINVFDYFEENNTAYYVMEYIKGNDLKTYTDNFRMKLNFELGMEYIQQVMEGLQELHEQGVIHRDISPDNIYIASTGNIKILDFGAARYSMTQRDKNLSVILKMGYAPLEQYSTKVKQGPWTDIYALGATFYHLFSGVQLPEATERSMGENVKSLKVYNQTIPDFFCKVIDKAISINKNDRYQSISEMISDIKEGMRSPTIFYASVGSIYGNQMEPAASDLMNNTKVAQKPTIPVVNLSGGGYGSSTPEINKTDNIFGIRVLAYILDIFLSAVIMIIFVETIRTLLASMNMLDGVGVPIISAIIILTPFLLTLINCTLESSSWRGTLGKKTLGIQVVKNNGSTLSTADSLKRNSIKLLNILLLLTEKNGLYLHEIKSDSKVIKR